MCTVILLKDATLSDLEIEKMEIGWSEWSPAYVWSSRYHPWENQKC